MKENIVAMSILVGDFQPRMYWNISIAINACSVTYADFA